MKASTGRGKFLKDYLAVGISLSLFSLKPLVFIPIITTYMGKEAYGVWSQVLLTTLFLGPVLTLRLMSALSRFLAGSRDDTAISGAYLFAVLIVFGMSAIVFGVSLGMPSHLSQLIYGDQTLTQYVVP